MKKLALVAALLLSGCAAKLQFIDRTNGAVHLGATGSTASSNGEANAVIDGVAYLGTWVYSQNGGGYALSTGFSNGSTTGTVANGTNAAFINANNNQSTFTSSYIASAQGNGFIHLRSSLGTFVRCVFTFNSNSNNGLGKCARNDGREFDLVIIR